MADCPIPPHYNESESLVGKILVLVRTSGLARSPVVEQLWNLGLRIIFIHPFEHELFAHFCEKWIVMDTDNIDSMEKAVREAVKSAPFNRESGEPDGICTFDDYAVFECAELCNRFKKRPQPFGTEEIRTTSSKDLFRTWCYENNVASPASLLVRKNEIAPSQQVASAYNGGMHYPIVMKCTSGAGKMQTKLCTCDAELDSHAKVMWDFIDTLKTGAAAKHILAHGEELNILLEEYVGGQEVDIDCIVDNGEIVFAPVADNFPTKPPFFAEMGGLVPSQLPEDAQLSLIQLLRDWVSAHGKKVHGALHFEAKYDPERPKKSYVIEVNCRLGGAETFMMTRAAYGVEMGECVARLALGLPAFRSGTKPKTRGSDNIIPIQRNYCASVNIMPPLGGGYLCEMRLPGEEEPALVKAQAGMMERTGWRYHGPPREFGCVVWMVARGKTAEEALVNIKDLTAKTVLRFRETTDEIPK